jgi:large subunit ribosomal protein L13
MMKNKPEEVVRMAVRRMLPKNKLGRVMLKKLKIYRGTEHEQTAQQPVAMEL